MKTLIVALTLACTALGGAAVFSTIYDQPAKAGSGSGVDPARMMTDAKGLPAADYIDYSVVFN